MTGGGAGASGLCRSYPSLVSAVYSKTDNEIQKWELVPDK